MSTIQSGCNQTLRFLLCKEDISRFALGGDSVLALHTSFPDRPLLTPEVNYIYSPFISSIYTQGNANANQKGRNTTSTYNQSLNNTQPTSYIYKL